MDSGNVIEIRNVKKSFKVYYDKGFELKERILFHSRNKYELRQVLKGISFDVKKGEAVGLVGKNGCGKSTTLKILNKIVYPDSGTVVVKGRISSLIELGAGFHPDMSGRENIYTNAAIFGLNRKEIDERLDKIITFSELEAYIDNPVRTYSSGMYMRLAFSVAINVDADVLLIDEILGVGDLNFQTKCFNKLMEIKQNGTTIIIVSHSLGQIEKICDRTLWIEDGFVREAGKPEDVHEHYKNSMEDKRQQRIKEEKQKEESQKKEIVEKQEILPDFCSKNARRYGNKKMEITDINLENLDGMKKNRFTRDENIVIKFCIDSKHNDEMVNIAFRLIREDGITCYASDYATKKHFELGTTKNFYHINEKKEGKIVIENRRQLISGSYFIDFVISREGIEVYDEICRAKEFEIEGEAEGIGVVELNTEWQL